MSKEFDQPGLSAGKLILILLACLAIYLPTTSHGFAMDDEYIVQKMVPGGVVNQMRQPPSRYDCSKMRSMSENDSTTECPR